MRTPLQNNLILIEIGQYFKINLSWKYELLQGLNLEK
jgi:hypothetical protein